MNLIYWSVFVLVKSLCTAFLTSNNIVYTKHNTHYMIPLNPLNTNNSEWSLPTMNGLQLLYKPPQIVLCIPDNVAHGLMIQCFVSALNANNDILIIQCDNFRKALNEYKLLIGVIGNDFLVGYIAVKNTCTSKNTVYIHTILPLNGNGVYNITGMFYMLNAQYKPCDFNYTDLSTYWKKIINLYSLY